MDKKAYITVEIAVPQQYAQRFLDAMTGNDDDVLLAAEKAMRERLQTDDFRGDDVEFSYEDRESHVRRDLMHLAERERRELITYGPRA